MRISKADIDEFLALKKLAVVGASRNKEKFGNIIYEDLKTSGRQVLAVNPFADMVEGDRCFAGLGALPEKPDGIVLVVPPEQGLAAVDEAGHLGIKHVWIQQGADSAEILRRCKDLDLKVINGECLLMYLEPVKSIHSFHRFFKRLFGQMPK